MTLLMTLPKERLVSCTFSQSKHYQQWGNVSDVAFIHHMSIDHKGHEYGPDSEEIIEAVKDIDVVLKQFVDHLANKGKSDEINLIVLSDHGMTDHTKVEEIRLSHYLTKESMDAIEFVVDDAGNIANLYSFTTQLFCLFVYFSRSHSNQEIR